MLFYEISSQGFAHHGVCPGRGSGERRGSHARCAVRRGRKGDDFALNRTGALAIPVCSARMPPIRNLILVLRDQLSSRKGFLPRRESLAAVRPGLSTGSGGPAV